MNSPSEDIKDILESSAVGLGLVFGTDLFVSRMPETPDQCVAVFDTGGEPPQPSFVYLKPTIQVRIRGAKTGYQTAYTLAESIRDALHDLTNETWNSTRYVGIWATSDIFFIGYDENDRPLFSVNFRIHRTST